MGTLNQYWKSVGMALPGDTSSPKNDQDSIKSQKVFRFKRERKKAPAINIQVQIKKKNLGDTASPKNDQDRLKFYLVKNYFRRKYY